MHLNQRQIPVDDDAMNLEEMLSDEADLTVVVRLEEVSPPF